MSKKSQEAVISPIKERYVQPGIDSASSTEGGTSGGTRGIVASGATDIVGAVMNLASTVVGYFGERANIKRQAKENRRLAQEEFQRNYQMWKEQNAYNAPSSQMARLKAAGLNPAILYGGSSGSVSGNSDQAPKLDYSGAQLASYASPLAALAAGTGQLGALLQARLQNAQIENLTASADKSREDAGRIGIERLIALQKLPYVGEAFKAQIGKDYAMSTEAYARAAEATKNLEVMAAQVNIYDTQNAALRLSLEIQQMAKDDIIESYSLSNQESRARISEINKRMEKYSQEILNLKEDWWLIQAQTYKANTEGDINVLQKDVTRKAAEKIDKEIDRISEETKLTKKQVKYYFYNNVVRPAMDLVGNVGSRLGGAYFLKH